MYRAKAFLRCTGRRLKRPAHNFPRDYARGRPKIRPAYFAQIGKVAVASKSACLYCFAHGKSVRSIYTGRSLVL